MISQKSKLFIFVIWINDIDIKNPIVLVEVNGLVRALEVKN